MWQSTQDLSNDFWNLRNDELESQLSRVIRFKGIFCKYIDFIDKKANFLELFHLKGFFAFHAHFAIPDDLADRAAQPSDNHSPQNRAEPRRTRAEPRRTAQNRAEPRRTRAEPRRTAQNHAKPPRITPSTGMTNTCQSWPNIIKIYSNRHFADTHQKVNKTHVENIGN